MDLVTKTTKRKINEIIVHCTATKEFMPVDVNTIDKWHKEKGWTGIGYHFVVYIDGTVHKGRNIDNTGAHCIGHNANSIGVCYVGGLDREGKPKDTRTEMQKHSLLTLLKQLKKDYPNAKIYGHRDFAAKACPCFDAKKEYSNL